MASLRVMIAGVTWKQFQIHFRPPPATHRPTLSPSSPFPFLGFSQSRFLQRKFQTDKLLEDFFGGFEQLLTSRKYFQNIQEVFKSIVSYFLKIFFASGGGRFPYLPWDVLHYVTLLLQHIRIIVGDDGFEPGTEQKSGALYQWATTSPYFTVQ